MTVPDGEATIPARFKPKQICQRKIVSIAVEI
jgi:hypothetical protein